MRRNYERNLIPVIRSVKHISTCGESTELNHGAHFCARWTFSAIVTCGNGSVPDSTGEGVCNTPHAANETPSVLTPYRLSSKRGQLRAGLRRHVILLHIICAVLWKSAVCHERNKDRLDKFSRGFQIETPSGIQTMVSWKSLATVTIPRPRPL